LLTNFFCRDFNYLTIIFLILVSTIIKFNTRLTCYEENLPIHIWTCDRLNPINKSSPYIELRIDSIYGSIKNGLSNALSKTLHMKIRSISLSCLNQYYNQFILTELENDSIYYFFFFSFPRIKKKRKKKFFFIVKHFDLQLY
jgi:hypothetical protein